MTLKTKEGIQVGNTTIIESDGFINFNKLKSVPAYATLASPTLSGVPTAPTALSGTSTSQIATTAFTQAAISNLIASAPAALDTLNELAIALGNDPSFATTVNNNISLKAPIASPIFTGTATAGNFSGPGTSLTGTASSLNIGGSAATITGVYSGALTSSQITTGLTYTPYNSTNPAGYGTGTVTAVTATGPVVSSGGTTPVISIPAATTTNSGYLTSADWTTFNGKQPSGTYATGTGTASGTNTGDQTNITGTAATITGIYSSTLVSSQITTALTFTPYNATNPAGYGTGTVTAVTATGPVVSSGGSTPIISIPAATTTVSGYLTSADWTTFNGKQPSGTYATGTGTASGTNTGDETLSSIKTKLGITVLSGSNTGDQTNITGTAATITGIYSNTLTSSQVTTALTFTPYNATNPAGYGTGTLTAVTATGPIVSSGGTTPVISIPAATTSIAGYLTSADWTTFNGKQPSGTYATGTGTASGSNTGDETLSSIKTKLGITVLSGSNTGDQTNITGTAATITGVYSGTLTASQITTGLTYTPYNATNPAGYGTGTVTAVTATGPVVSSGGTTPIISIPVATTTVSGYLTSSDWTTFNGKQPSGTYATGTGTASGTNTGDQTNITGTAATITGIYSGTLVSSQVTTALTFTPYNATNPAGYGTGTLTAVTATGPVVSSGGTTPIISIPAATTSIAGYLTSADWTTFNGKQPSGTYATGTGTASGTNTGDETLTSIKTKLGITVLSGSNTGDQTNITGTAATITGVYSGSITSSQITTGLTFTPYNATNPAGYGTGTVTAVTATGPVVSSGGTTPVISIPAATTTVSGYLTSADWTTFNGKQPSGTYATGTGTASGSNTGDETLSSIKTKLGITVLSGSNTGDQTNITGTAATITGIYSGTLTSTQITSGLTYTPYNSTNPAGYGTGTLTAVTATGPVVSSGGTTPIISIPAATTSVAGYLTSADWTTFNGKQPSGTYATGTGTASGTNTGDQTNITGTAATITGVYSGSITSSQITSGLTYTPYNATNPAGYGNGTLTAVTATGPVVSSGGSTPIISIPAATTSVAGYLTSADWTTFNNKAPINNPVFTGVATLPIGSTAPGLLGSAASAITAAGTNQATATALTSDVNIITTAAAGTGVAVQGATSGKYTVIVNRSANIINVYPYSGHQFDGIGVNVPISLPINGFLEMFGSSFTQWHTTTNAIINGSMVIGNISGNSSNITGITSILNGGTGQITASAALAALGGYPSSNPNGYSTTAGTITAVTATGPVVSSGGTTPVISIPAATTSVAGYLTSADWTTFNSKQPYGTYATGTGTASGTNTGDQTNITGTAATITGIYSSTLTSSQVTSALTFTPYNATNPAGYTNSTGTGASGTWAINISGQSATSTTASNATITTDNTTNGTRYIVFGVTGGATQPLYNNTNLTFNPSTGLLTSTAFSGNITGDNNSYSDPKLKENITKIKFPIDIIKKLNGVNFNWKHGFDHISDKAGKYDIGILADEVQNVLPEIVTESNEIDGKTFKTVCYSKIIPVLIEAIKELDMDNKSLNNQIKCMQEELLIVKDFIKKFSK